MFNDDNSGQQPYVPPTNYGVTSDNQQTLPNQSEELIPASFPDENLATPPADQPYSAPVTDQPYAAPPVNQPYPPQVEQSYSQPDPFAQAPAEPVDPSAFSDTPADSPSTDAPSDNSNGDVSDDLLDIKQQALQQLSPLVNTLDQGPEDKFRTTMMMIQASDNQSLLKTAYEAAQQIPDDKTRAQALLDVVNEINYFTQQ